MKYRVNRRTGDRISEIGIGSSYMYNAGMDEAVKALRRAWEGGINYFDLASVEAGGKYVYCNHCQPCPAGLDIGLIDKYYDLARAGDNMAAEHCRTLEKIAADCVACGHCDGRCPFHVKQSARMAEIREYFGR